MKASGKRTGLEKLATGNKPIRLRLVIDSSASIHDAGLETALVAAVNHLQSGLVGYPDNRICRAMFDTELYEVDGLSWVHPANAAAFGESYHATGFKTYLDQFVEGELRRQASRAHTVGETIDVVAFVTDGINNGTDRTAQIRVRVAELIANAARQGGFAKANTAFWYWGVGLTVAHHFQQAHDRFGLPPEWITWSAARVAEVEHTGRRVGASLASMADIGGTIIGGY